MSFKEPLATTLQPGIVQVGSGLTITPSGILSADPAGALDNGYFYSTQLQTNPVASEVNIVTFNNTGISQGVTVVGGTQLTVSKTGSYNLQFTVQIQKTGGQEEDMDIWLRENGADFLDTNTALTIFGNGSILLAGWSYLLELQAGDYLELAWQAPSTDIQLFTLPEQVDPVRPVTPSARVTVIEV
jgi:hypothetical protein